MDPATVVTTAVLPDEDVVLADDPDPVRSGLAGAARPAGGAHRRQWLDPRGDHHLGGGHEAPVQPHQPERVGGADQQGPGVEPPPDTAEQRILDLPPPRRPGPVHHETRPVAQIARHLAVLQQQDGRRQQSVKTVAALAHQYGIDTRHKPRLHDEIDRDWLYTEYVVHRRTLPDLAAEKGMTAPNMSRWAQRHGIPRRPPGLASTAANLNATEETRTGSGTTAASPEPDRRCCTVEPVRNGAPISDPHRGGRRPGIAPGRAHFPDRPAGG